MKTQRSTTRIAASIAVGILIAVGLGPSATAGSSTINCTGSLRDIKNGNAVPYAWASTDSNGQCGTVQIQAKIYVGGGVYSWAPPTNFGTSSGLKVITYDTTTLSHSRHYYAYYGNPTSKDISV